MSEIEFSTWSNSLTHDTWFNTLEYRGMLGSIKKDLGDDCFYGKILEISDLVNYEAKEMYGLGVAFKEAVDDYLDSPALKSSKFKETGTNNLMEEDDA